MICFPLDNTGYEAKALGAWNGTRTRGVFADDGHFAVTPNGGMSIAISSGLAWLKMDDFWGVYIYEAETQIRDLDTADGSLSRIDAVCVRIDKNRNVGEVVIKRGSYSPQPPTVIPPTRNIDFDEIYVATIMVRAGATVIQASDITDQRLNEQYCGIMRDGVTGIPSQALYNQFITLINDYDAEGRVIIDGLLQELSAAQGGTYYAPRPIQAFNVSVPTSAFTEFTPAPDTEESALYAMGYVFRAAVAVTDVLSSMIPYLTFSIPSVDACGAAIAGQFQCYNGGVYLYADGSPASDITILTAEFRKDVTA